MQMGKRPMMWSPLVWDPNAPPAALVDAEAILNLWTGDIKTLAYNITLKVRFCSIPEFCLILVILVRFNSSNPFSSKKCLYKITREQFLTASVHNQWK
jgi:hypothetical protein